MINVGKIKQLIEKEDECPNLDYKDELNLETEGDKAQFVKDVLSLANSGELAHIITGIEDGTRKPIGIKVSHKAEQLNEILKDKCDPPLYVEYAEKNILGYKIGVIEINGDNPPYIVAVHDRYGGILSKSTKNYCYIWRGMVLTRAFNKNEGASRADLDKMYKTKYITLESELTLSHETSIKKIGEEKNVTITFYLVNGGEVIATDVYVLVHFINVLKILKCGIGWSYISSLNDDRLTVSKLLESPVVHNVRSQCSEVTVSVKQEIEEIETNLILGATNMRTKEGPYLISLKEQI